MFMYKTKFMSFYNIKSAFGYCFWYIGSQDKCITLIISCEVMIILSYIVIIIFEFKFVFVLCSMLFNTDSASSVFLQQPMRYKTYIVLIYNVDLEM